MNKNVIRRIIKEELKRKPLKEMGYYSDYPRGGEDEAEGYESELDYCLRYGLDLPENHPAHGLDFKEEDPNMDDDWMSGRAEVLGDEYASTPFENGKYLTGAAKAEWQSQGGARRY